MWPGPTIFNDVRLLIFTVYRGTVTGVGLLTSVILLYLMIRDRIVTASSAKLVLISVVVFLICKSIYLPLTLCRFIPGTSFTTNAGCQFFVFIREFFWVSKGLLVMSIAIFAYFEGQNDAIYNVRIKFLATLATVVVVTAAATGVRAGFAFEDPFEDCDSGSRSFFHLFVDTVAKWLIIKVCMFVPVIVSVVMLIVLMCKRRGTTRRGTTRRGTTAPHQVVPIVIVTTYTLLWTPVFLYKIPRERYDIIFVYYRFWIGAMFQGMMDFEFALTPILLLALPTQYNKALRKRCNKLCCRQRDECISQYMVELRSAEDL